MRKIVVVLFVFAVCSVLGLCWNPSPSALAPKMQVEQGEQLLVETAKTDNHHTPDEGESVERIEVVKPEQPAEILISPIEALMNYAGDMRFSSEQDRKNWFVSTGATLNHPNFRKLFGERWGYGNHEFEPNILANASLYGYWTARASEAKLDLLGSLLSLYWEEQEYDLWRHWLFSMPNHRAPGDIPRMAGELRRYIELRLSSETDDGQRVRDSLTMLAMLSGIDKSVRTDFLDLFAGTVIAKAAADGGGVTMLMSICAAFPYTEVADRIQTLLRHSSADIQWGAVEMLRQYAAFGQIHGEALVALLPNDLIEKAGGERSGAAMELLATFGGQNGLERVLRLTHEGNPAFRGFALEFLALRGRIGTTDVMRYYGDQEISGWVVNCLGTLAQKDPLAASELEQFLQNPNEKVRQTAAAFLYSLGRIPKEEAAKHGVVAAGAKPNQNG